MRKNFFNKFTLIINDDIVFVYFFNGKKLLFLVLLFFGIIVVHAFALCFVRSFNCYWCDKSDMSVTNELHDLTLQLKLPKFTKKICVNDIHAALQSILPSSEDIKYCPTQYNSNWHITLSSTESKIKLLQQGVISVKRKKCVIQPFKEGEVCGKVHWLPSCVTDVAIRNILNRFGDISHFKEDSVSINGRNVVVSVRFFVMTLKPGVLKDHIPHFISIDKCEGLVTIKGRHPLCFGCKGVGHKKSECDSAKTLEKRKLYCKLKKRRARENNATSSELKQSSSTGSTSSQNVPKGTADVTSNEHQRNLNLNFPKLPSQSRTSVASAQVASTSSTKASKKTQQNNKPSTSNDLDSLQQLIKLVESLSVLAPALNAQAIASTSADTSSATAQTKKKKKKKKKAKKPTENNSESGITAQSNRPVTDAANNQKNTAPEQKEPKTASVDQKISSATITTDSNGIGITGGNKKKNKKKKK